ncbi:methyltransferase domain-containing protein [Lipingzhangella sp. LS1_29]|uniref:Protein-L-isoaspartate O-methyltransferase n=1 Tax=Lipingzhangella rawalii TaxID=2055835 RepID=A0ABU2H969_9ACTN|nr:methyltransferase domain-containing protein [Lipingzhangella rawalii]MDS1271404.1 methyltransferase domain-containing protein [Lipingzhangella rawalii]
MSSVSKAMAAVDRAHYIPGLIYVRSENTGWLIPLHRDEEPDRWRAEVDQDAPVVTAVAPDPRAPAEILEPATGRGYESTSSSTAPWLMARMLDALQLEPGMRVLEIGTGTGYNAALVDHLVGPSGHVVSVEVTPEVATRARAALVRDGRHVTVVTGDGAEGWLPGAPYDRIIATASVASIPPAWLQQTCPGGIILAPLADTVHPAGPLARLAVNADGTAQGACLGEAHFMPLRSDSVTTAPQQAEGTADQIGINVDTTGTPRLWRLAPDNAAG